MGEVGRKCLKLYPGFPDSLEPRKAKNQFVRLTIQIPLSLLSEVNQAAFKNTDFLIPKLQIKNR